MDFSFRICAFLINKFQYPDIKEDEVIEKIDQIKKDIWLEINENLTALEKVKIIKGPNIVDLPLHLK